MAQKQEGVSKMAAVNEALDALGRKATTATIQAYVKENYNHDMSRGMVSNYKSILRKRKGKRARRAAAASAAEAAPAASRGGKGGISMEDLLAVKALAERHGADKIRELLKVLGR